MSSFSRITYIIHEGQAAQAHVTVTRDNLGRWRGTCGILLSVGDVIELDDGQLIVSQTFPRPIWASGRWSFEAEKV